MLQETKRSEFIATFGHSVTYKKKGINSCSAVYQLLQKQNKVHDDSRLEWLELHMYKL